MVYSLWRTAIFPGELEWDYLNTQTLNVYNDDGVQFSNSCVLKSCDVWSVLIVELWRTLQLKWVELISVWPTARPPARPHPRPFTKPPPEPPHTTQHLLEDYTHTHTHTLLQCFLLYTSLTLTFYICHKHLHMSYSVLFLGGSVKSRNFDLKIDLEAVQMLKA